MRENKKYNQLREEEITLSDMSTLVIGVSEKVEWGELSPQLNLRIKTGGRFTSKGFKIDYKHLDEVIEKLQNMKEVI